MVHSLPIERNPILDFFWQGLSVWDKARFSKPVVFSCAPFHDNNGGTRQKLDTSTYGVEFADKLKSLRLSCSRRISKSKEAHTAHRHNQARHHCSHASARLICLVDIQSVVLHESNDVIMYLVPRMQVFPPRFRAFQYPRPLRIRPIVGINGPALP